MPKYKQHSKPPYEMKFTKFGSSFRTRIPKPVIDFHEEEEWIVKIDKGTGMIKWLPVRKEIEE